MVDYQEDHYCYDYSDSENEENNFAYDVDEYERKQSFIMNKHPENKIWIKQVFKWIKNNDNKNKKFMTIWDEESPLKCVFVLLKKNYDNIGVFTLSVSEKEPYFPFSPPILEWLEPKLNFIDSFSIKYIECFRKEYWNLCQDLDDVLNKLYSYISKIKQEERNYSEKLINHLYKISEISGIYPSTISSDLPKFGTFYENKNTNLKKCEGTGYSQGNIEKWNTEIWMKKIKEANDVLVNIYNYICNNDITECDIDNILFSALIPYMERLIKNYSLQEINKNPEKYIIIYQIGDWIYKNIGKLDLHNELYSVAKEIKYISQKTEHFIKKNENILTETEIKILDMVKNYDLDNKEIKNNQLDLDKYVEIMKPLQCKLVEELNNHTFKDKKCTPINQGKWFRRLFNEWKDFNKSLPLHEDGSVFIRWYGDAGYSHLFKILIIPPLSTPYGGGCYEFDMFIPSDYPNENPSMKFLTTGGGAVRFNPNLYNCGKICLSLLGTWSGEKWDPQISNIYQICVSILALVFVDEPYFNEPGYQNSKMTEKGIKESEKYNDNIKIQNIRYGIINMIKKPPKDFKEVIENHYRLRIEQIKDNILDWISKSNNPKPLEILLMQLEELKI